MNQTESIQAVHSALEQAGVAETAFRSGSISLYEVSPVSLARLHLSPSSTFSSAHLPAATGKCAGTDPSVLCLRPGEWLLISESMTPGKLRQWIRDLEPEPPFTALDLSGGLSLLRLRGAGSPWLLNKLSGLDFQSAAKFGEHCARTRMGHFGIIVHYHERSGTGATLDLVVDRSLAAGFWRLLLASAPHADELAARFGTAA